MRILGIDPGKSGALALIDTDACTVAVEDMPIEQVGKTKDATSALGFARMVRAAQADAAFLELVHSMPGQGTTSMFSFGRAYGICLGGVAGANVSLWPITPQDWKATMKTPRDKKLAVARACQLVPSAYDLLHGPRGGALDGRAEAILLAFYGCLKLQCVPAKGLRTVEYPR